MTFCIRKIIYPVKAFNFSSFFYKEKYLSKKDVVNEACKCYKFLIGHGHRAETAIHYSVTKNVALKF